MTDLTADGLNMRLALAADAVRAASPVHLQFPSHLRRDSAGIPQPARPRSRLSLAQRGSIAEILQAAYPDETVVDRSEPPPSSRMQGLLSRCWLVSSLSETGVERDAFPVIGPVATYVVDGIPLVTAIHLPQLNETITAARGCGVQIEGRTLRVATAAPPDNSIIVGLNEPPEVTEQIRRLAGWRLPAPEHGPLALMCYLVTGRIDGLSLALPQPEPWELAAGTLIVREAGGVVEVSDVLTLQVRAAASFKALSSAR